MNENVTRSSQLQKIQQKNFKSLVDSKEFSDVTFEIGNAVFGIKEFHGIRLLFAAQSDVLKAMLYGNMMESSNDNKVIINDIHPSGFEWFESYCCAFYLIYH